MKNYVVLATLVSAGSVFAEETKKPGDTLVEEAAALTPEEEAKLVAEATKVIAKVAKNLASQLETDQVKKLEEDQKTAEAASTDSTDAV